MKINIQNNLLQPLLSRLCSLVGSVEPFPAASMLLFDVSNDQAFRITSTSLEMEMTCLLEDGFSADHGRLLLPARKLLDVCSKAREDSQITIESSNGHAQVITADAKYRLNELPADDFPLLDASDALSKPIEVRQDDLKFLFDKTTFSMADNDVMHLLNGVLFSIQPDSMIMAATDRHRLAVCQTPVQTQLPDQTLVLPRKVALEIQKLLKDNESTAEISVDPRYFQIVLGDTTLKAKLLEGEYPDYQRVIPTNPAQSIAVDAQQLRQTVARVCVVLQAEKKAASIRLLFQGGQLKATSTNQEGEEVEAVQDIDYQGPAVEIGFNPLYLSDVLSVVTANELIFDVTDADGAILLREQGVDTVKYVIMPVRL